MTLFRSRFLFGFSVVFVHFFRVFLLLRSGVPFVLFFVDLLQFSFNVFGGVADVFAWRLGAWFHWPVQWAGWSGR